MLGRPIVVQIMPNGIRIIVAAVVRVDAARDLALPRPEGTFAPLRKEHAASPSREQAEHRVKSAARERARVFEAT